MSQELEAVFETELASYQKVIELIARGKTPSQIQSDTGIPPAQQRKMYAQFEEYANNDFQTQKRAKAIIAELDVQYTYIIRKLEETLEEIEESLEPDYKLKKEILKELASVNKMRAEQLTKAGVLNSEGVADQIAHMEKEHQAVLDLLKRVAKEAKGPEFRRVREIIADGLAQIRNEVIEV